ncbi:ribonuclease Z [Weissella diestrammenae]|uniref:Ribonuclease Z n=1 Tax=Weissella diestrammenae TaxID=1162633 RepID=A0A7G9T5U4_9LACO|nr:ribonuclease Z [Weissella diestrammenae]MCM0582299.1 ribonuclease Z [Weissella diestrammenae]QNN75469.1 ribonuclease Z [Weissella diestrammenae]
MQLEFLGTGAGVPARYRNVTSIALRLLEELNEVWLFDAGEGTQQQMLRSTIRPRKVTKIFVTHLHGDHIFGLPGLLSSRSFQGGEEPLDIFGPRGIKNYIETSLRTSQTHLTYRINYHEQPDAGGTVFENEKFKVEALPLDHRILSFGYRIIEADHAGELLVDRLRELQIPAGPIYGRLKRGEDVVLSDGRTILAADVVGPSKKGRVVTILGDTRKTDNVRPLVQDATVVVHEATYGKGEGKLARAYYHSTSIQAAESAANGHVGRLLLTHISARYPGRLANELAYAAQTVFANTRVVQDFDVYDIPMGLQTNAGPIKLVEHVAQEDEEV